MPHLSQSGTVPVAKGHGARFLARLGVILWRLGRCITEPWLRRAAIRELERLGPRALRDAGIEPYEIEAMVDARLEEERREE